MFKDNIDVVIKRVSSKEGNLSEIIYEGKVNFGVLIIMECMIDNFIRMIVNFKSYFNKM